MIQEQKKLLESHQDILKIKLSELNTLIENGVALPSQGKVIESEILKIKQNLVENEIMNDNLINALNLLTGDSITISMVFEIPENLNISAPVQFNNPEYALFATQKNKLDFAKELKKKNRFPLLSAFGQAGYGKPGYNMLSNEFDEFYIVGAKLNWKIWDWKNYHRDKSILQIQSEIINSNEENFRLHQNITLQNHLAEIKKYEEWLKLDNEIVSLKKDIAENASEQLKNGSITSSQYLIEANALHQAKINLEIHKLQLLKSKYEYFLAQGIL